MKTSDFDFELPREFIAQNPATPRDHSRLLIYDTKSDKIFHKKFYQIEDFLTENDVLVLNKSKVVPARILFEVDGAEKEMFFLKKNDDFVFRFLVKPGKYFKVGRKGRLINGLEWEVIEVLDDGSRLIRFFDKDALAKLFDLGSTPLPPYITEFSGDVSRYQTVFAEKDGSVAAPTAGLHFTAPLFEKLEAKEVELERVLLHVGRGTFLPVSVEDLQNHKMHTEYFELEKDVAHNLNLASRDGKSLVAVGTTSVRVLESTSDQNGVFVPQVGDTEIFIFPGYKWKKVDKLITNFHLPKSTLLMLVASFLESKGVAKPVEKLKELYEVAKSEGYRFYSFGDAMFLF